MFEKIKKLFTRRPKTDSSVTRKTKEFEEEWNGLLYPIALSPIQWNLPTLQTISPTMNPAMQQTLCPFCLTRGCQIYSDLKCLYDACDIFHINEFPTEAWIEIHYRTRVVNTFKQDILFSTYRFNPGEWDYGFLQQFFTGSSITMWDSAGTLRSIEHVKSFCTETPLRAEWESKFSMHHVYFYVD
jgi:hypothetical protein